MLRIPAVELIVERTSKNDTYEVRCVQNSEEFCEKLVSDVGLERAGHTV